MGDSKHTDDLLKHLEKEKALLMDAYRSMSHDMHRLVVEQNMLMHKFSEYMAAQVFVTKKNTEAVEDAAKEEDSDQETSSASVSSEEEDDEE